MLNAGSSEFERRLSADFSSVDDLAGGDPGVISDVFADDSEAYIDEARSVERYRRGAGLLP